MTPDYRAVVFDLDGTLTPVRSVWQHIHERLGQWESEALRHQAAFEAGEIGYAEFCARDAAHWKGMAEGRLRAITDAIPYRPGARECVARIQEGGRLVGVISTGLTLLALRVRRELRLAYTIANRLVARRGILTGEVQINVEHEHKGEAVDLFCRQFGIEPRQIVTVGDSGGDISMFERSGFSIAFNPVCPRTARAARRAHTGESLLDIMSLLPFPERRPS